MQTRNWLFLTMSWPELNNMSSSLLNYKKQKPMENIQHNDQEQSKQGQQITDDNQKPSPQVEQSDSVIGDVHPTERSDTFRFSLGFAGVVVYL